MNRINPKKLQNSKWTAVEPMNREKHFMVTDVELNDEEIIVSCSLEAVMTKRVVALQWQELQDDTQWKHGWK
jgi:tryptophan-rich hypothetical protein